MTISKSTCLALLAVLAFPIAANAVVLDIRDGQLFGASDVYVDGTFYSVVFTKGNCIVEFDGCDSVADFDFDNQADAEAAAFALANTVLVGIFDSDPMLTNGCDWDFSCNFYTPFGFGDNNDNTIVASGFRNYHIETFDEVTGRLIRLLEPDLNYAQTWARWSIQTSPVPVPPALLLLGSGLLGLVAITRRRIVG